MQNFPPNVIRFNNARLEYATNLAVNKWSALYWQPPDVTYLGLIHFVFISTIIQNVLPLFEPPHEPKWLFEQGPKSVPLVVDGCFIRENPTFWFTSRLLNTTTMNTKSKVKHSWYFCSRCSLRYFVIYTWSLTPWKGIKTKWYVISGKRIYNLKNAL